ncbi:MULTISPECIES: glycosyltransferase [Virgibacillus]|uniref:Glycosyl transferases group 1 n=1 Tax=Virgibacillus dokdonensis TaxID=302167 RepID=A0A2K9IYN7_9BACI|nr:MULTISPECIES: glycosyltransferase [Virgibacillus]AUJ24797.1 Glycosyl transferases group 1 [Virgibacillus dokdonensis]NWO14835.1 glycosyltransferase [Virgibacillus sp.]
MNKYKKGAFQGIIVLNEKYFPSTWNFTAKVGATSFTMNVMDCLYKNNRYAGLILYKRDESLTYPVLEEKYIKNHIVITMKFNFNIETFLIKNVLEAAISRIMLMSSPFSLPIVYYQTDTLLKYHPQHVPCCVTHHGPFVEDFINHYSASESYIAFESKEKACHLTRQQKEGLLALNRKENVFVLQHSELQKNFIMKKGIDEKNIFKIVPPIALPNVKEITLMDKIFKFISVKKNEMLIISTVARIDYFKNLEFLITSLVKSLDSGIPIKVLIAGDPKDKGERRVALINLIPEHLKQHFLIIQTLPQNELYSLFKLVRNKATFLCTSRYETLGITPLEAAMMGVYTITPNSSLVEASMYFSDEDKFDYRPNQLESILRRIYKEKRYVRNLQADHLKKIFSDENFVESLLSSFQLIEQRFTMKQELIN